MYYGCSREERDNEAKKRIADWREMAGMYAAVAPVIRDFDGKIYNCKLDKALKERTGLKIWAQKRYNYIDISAFTSSGKNYTLATITQEQLTDGKRIPADLILEKMRDNRARFLRDAAQLESEMERVDAIKNQIEAIKKQLKGVLDGLSYSCKEIYGLDYWITRH